MGAPEQLEQAALRVFDARDAAVVFADEPTAALDAENRGIVMQLLEEESQRGPVVVATHDEQLLANAALTIRLRDGRTA